MNDEWLEPMWRHLGTGDYPEEVLLASIAISLKRIADAMAPRSADDDRVEFS